MSIQVTKKIIPYTAQRVILTSAKPVKDVLTALDDEVNANGAGINLMRVLITAQTKDDLVNGINKLTEGKRDFLLFASGSHSHWVSLYLDGKKLPESHIYTIGNPLIAQTMLRHDMSGGLHVPPKLLVQELEDGSGSQVLYDLPSSVVLIGEYSVELEAAAHGLDDKFERMVRKVLG